MCFYFGYILSLLSISWPNHAPPLKLTFLAACRLPGLTISGAISRTVSPAWTVTVSLGHCTLMSKVLAAFCPST